jgi:hypothetical protein
MRSLIFHGLPRLVLYENQRQCRRTCWRWICHWIFTFSLIYNVSAHFPSTGAQHFTRVCFDRYTSGAFTTVQEPGTMLLLFAARVFCRASLNIALRRDAGTAAFCPELSHQFPQGGGLGPQLLAAGGHFLAARGSSLCYLGDGLDGRGNFLGIGSL